MADFFINAGVKFSPKDIDTAAIRQKIAETAANTTVKLQKFSVSKMELRTTITTALEQMRFTLNLKNINVNSGSVQAKLQKVIDDVNKKAVLNPKVSKNAAGALDVTTTGKSAEVYVKTLDLIGKSTKAAQKSTNDFGQSIREANRRYSGSSDKLNLVREKLILTAKAAQQGKDGLKIFSSAMTQAGNTSVGGARKMQVLLGKTKEVQVSAKGVKVAVEKLKGLRNLAFMKPGEAERWKKVNAEISRSTAEVARNRDAYQRQSAQLRFNAQQVSSLSKTQNNLNRLYSEGNANFEVYGANLAKITQRFTTYLVSIKLLITAQQAFNFAVRSIVKFDDALQDLRKVLSATPKELSALTASLFEVGRQTGASFDQMAQSYNEIVRQGLSAEAGLQRLKATMTAVSITELNVAEATNFMTATMNIFGDEVKDETEALDILSRTADKSAASATQIAQSFQRSGAAAKAVGVSYRQLNAITAATIEQTKVSATTIGAALKTIFSRIVTSTKAIRDQANAWGANITAADSVFDILRKLSGIYSQLDKGQRGQLSYLVAGRRRFTELAGILQSFGKTQKLLSEQLSSTGIAEGKQAKELEKLSTQVTLLKNSFQETIVVLGGFDKGAGGASSLRDTIISVLTTLTGIAKTVTGLYRDFEGLGGIAEEIGSVFRGIGKAVFFTVGATIMKQLYLGFSNMVKLGGLFKEVLAGIAGQLSIQNTTIRATGVQEDKVLNIEQQRLRTIREISKAAEVSLRSYAKATVSQRRLDANAKKGRTKLAVAAVAIASIQATTEQMRKFADSLKKSDSAAEKFAGSLVESGASATDFGANIALLGGPIAGVMAGFFSLTFSIGKVINAYSKVSDSQSKLISGIHANFINIRDAAKAGRFVEEGFKKVAKKGQTVAQTLVVAEGAIKALKDPFTGLDAQLRRSKDSLIKITREVDTAIRSADLAKRATEFAQKFKTDISKFKIQIDAGQVEKEFDPVINSMADYIGQVHSLKSNIDSIGGSFALLNRAQNALNQLGKKNGKTTKDIITSYGLETDEVISLHKSLLDVNKDIDKQADILETELESIDGLQKLIDSLTDKYKDIVSESQKNGDKLEEAKVLMGQINRYQTALNQAQERQAETNDKLNKLHAESSRLKERESKAYDDAGKKLESIVFAYKTVTQEITKANLALQLQSKRLKDNQKNLDDEAKFQIKLNKLQQGVSFTRDQEAAIKTLLRKREVAIRTISEKEANQVAKIEELRKAAEDNVDLRRAENLAKQIEETKKAFAENKAAVFEKITAEIIPKVNAEALKAVQNAEKTLSNVRLSFVEQATAREEQFAQRRIDFIKAFGDELLGKKALEGEFRSLGDAAKKTFGELGALQVKEQTKAAALSIKAILNQLRELKKQGVGETQQLTQAVEARGKVVQIQEDLIGKKREAILDHVRNSSNKAAAAETSLIDARKKIPALNAAIINSEKQVASAQDAVVKATNQLRDSYQAAADAEGQYKFDVLKATFEIKASTGVIASAGSKIQELSSIYANVTNDISLSQNKLLTLQKDIADEMLNVYKNQFDAIQGLGVRAATASGEDFAKLAQGLSDASKIASGADVGKFTAEQISNAREFENIFPVIKEKIAEFGLEKLGIDKSVLKDLQGNMLELAKTSAESGKQQVDAAYQQIAISQQALANAEEQLSQAKDQLMISQQQKDVQLQTVGTLRGQSSLQRANYIQVQKHAARQISLLNDQSAKLDAGNVILSSIDNNISALTKSIENQVANIKSLAGSVKIPNAAGGSLTGLEARGILSAARREKRAMPAGSNLMLANTSEVVLTKKQAGSIGLSPIPKRFAAEGNANAQAIGLENATAALTSTINTLLNKLNSPGFVNQNISVQVDSQRKVQVTGLDAIDRTVRRATEERFGQFASKEEQDAINDTVVHIVGKLQEMGIVNSIGG